MNSEEFSKVLNSTTIAVFNRKLEEAQREASKLWDKNEALRIRIHRQAELLIDSDARNERQAELLLEMEDIEKNLRDEVSILNNHLEATKDLNKDLWKRLKHQDIILGESSRKTIQIENLSRQLDAERQANEDLRYYLEEISEGIKERLDF